MTDQIQSSAIAGLLETLDADGRFFNGMSLPIAGANEIRRLAPRIAELEAELIKEAARTADYKLRAEQFEQRLDMANKLGNEARAELAALNEVLRPSEAVYAFAAWLTTRKQRVTFSGTDEASIAAELVSSFIESQGLESPRDDYHTRLNPYPVEAELAAVKAVHEAVAVPDWVEALAESWDGCMYDAPGETLDIGASIRRAAQAAKEGAQEC